MEKYRASINTPNAPTRTAHTKPHLKKERYGTCLNRTKFKEKEFAFSVCPPFSRETLYINQTPICPKLSKYKAKNGNSEIIKWGKVWNDTIQINKLRAIITH